MANVLEQINAKYVNASISAGRLYRDNHFCWPESNSGYGVDKDRDGSYDIYIAPTEKGFKEYELCSSLSSSCIYYFSPKGNWIIEKLTWLGCHGSVTSP